MKVISIELDKPAITNFDSSDGYYICKNDVVVVYFNKGWWLPSYREIAKIIFLLSQLYGKEEVLEQISNWDESVFAEEDGYVPFQSPRERSSCPVCGGKLCVAQKRWKYNHNYVRYQCLSCKYLVAGKKSH